MNCGGDRTPQPSQSAIQPFLESSRNAPLRLWGGALRDDAKNGCVADYSLHGIRFSHERVNNPWLPIQRK